MKKYVLKGLIHFVNVLVLGCMLLGVGAFMNSALMEECNINVSVITSNSMEPTLMTNCLVLTDYSVPFDSIQKGDIIEYKSDAHKLNVQHRAHTIYKNKDGNGTFAIMTQGDSYEHVVQDPWTCKEEDYKGRVICDIPSSKGLIEFVCGSNLQEDLNVVRMFACIMFLLTGIYLVLIALREVYRVINKGYQVILYKIENKEKK
ncbi:MAG: signal peptidase I [Bacilli bacterium]|nr:signal peptidase I [Bacilli bacterium]